MVYFIYGIGGILWLPPLPPLNFAAWTEIVSSLLCAGTHHVSHTCDTLLPKSSLNTTSVHMDRWTASFGVWSGISPGV